MTEMRKELVDYRLSCAACGAPAKCSTCSAKLGDDDDIYCGKKVHQCYDCAVDTAYDDVEDFESGVNTK